MNFREFLLQEDSRGNIMRMLGFNKTIADYFHEADHKNSFIIAKWFMEFLEDFYGGSSPSACATVVNDMTEFGATGVGTTFHMTLSLFHKTISYGLSMLRVKPQLVKKLSWKELKEVQERLDSGPEPMTILTFPNGWRWDDLRSTKSAEHGKQMGHCGSDPGDCNLIALIDNNGKHRVTASWDYLARRLNGMSGRKDEDPAKIGNSVPHVKYKPYVDALIEKLGGQYRGGMASKFRQ